MHGDLKHLLCQTLDGDPHSARALWCAVGPGAVAFARSILRSQQDAEDVVQVVMCRLLRLNTSEARGIDDVRAYVLRAVRNQCISHLRSKHRRARAELQANTQGTSRAYISSGNGDLDADARLRELVAQLPRREREVVVLKHSAGLSLEQIAAAVGAPKSTIASRYQAGLDRLRRWLKEREAAHLERRTSDNLVTIHSAERRTS